MRDEFAVDLGAAYLTLDRKEHRERARKAPNAFLSVHAGATGPLIVDEVQKVPDLFDALKVEVDEQRRPGRFLLSGSTEFSRRTGIRESLTGRIGLVHLYPMTVSELCERPLTSPWVSKKGSATSGYEEIEKWLSRGGMPGFCFLRSDEERSVAIEGWLDTTCHRDLDQVLGARLSPELALDVLSAIAELPRPSLAQIAHKLRADARRIKKHVEALEALLLLHRIEPHPAGIGKPYYLLFDAGVARHLGASREMRLRIWAINEIRAQHEYAGAPSPRLYHFQSSGKSHLDLVVRTSKGTLGVLLSDEQAFSPYALRTLRAFQAREPSALLWLVAPIRERATLDHGIEAVPWTHLS